MRVLLIRPGPQFSVQDVAFGWRDGLRELGVDVADFNFDDRVDFYSQAEINEGGTFRKVFPYDVAIRHAQKGILSACYEFWPDVVVVVTGFYVQNELLDLIRSRGHKVVLLCTESPYEDDKQSDRAAHADLTLLNDPTNLEFFRTINQETFYVPHAYDPKKHHPGPGDPDKACDFAFVGTGFPSRVTFFEQIDWSGIAATFAGNWETTLRPDSPLRELIAHRLDFCIDNAETAEVYRSAKTSLNLYRQEASEDGMQHGWSCGPREIELAACGTYFLRDARPESDELFPMLPTFSSPEEVRPLIDWALAHPKEREEAARGAREAIANRTFANNARWLLNHLDS